MQYIICTKKKDGYDIDVPLDHIQCSDFSILLENNSSKAKIQTDSRNII